MAARFIVALVASVTFAWPDARGATAPAPRSAAEAECRPYYHDACSEAIGAWLPSLGFASDLWERGRSTSIARLDAFGYGPEARRNLGLLGGHFPFAGTAFVYGTAGPTKGQLVYDRRHRIALYEQGCCSWSEVVAAADTPAPPKRVADEDLARLATLRGIRLGQTPADVMKIYGRAKAVRVDAHPGVRALAYDAASGLGPTCRQFDTLYFRANRLVLIDLQNSC